MWREIRDTLKVVVVMGGKERNRAEAKGVGRSRKLGLLVCFQIGIGMTCLYAPENDAAGSWRRSIKLINPWPS